jgi:hypothetical protein
MNAMKSRLCIDMVGDGRWRDAATFPAEPSDSIRS